MKIKSIPQGVIASIVTPFLADGAIDWDALRSETQLLDRSPVAGVCVGGLLSGTAGALPEELFQICQAVRQTIQKPLFAMFYPDTQIEAGEMLRAVLAGGADVVLAAQPHYLCQPNTAGLIEMFAELREDCGKALLLADCFPEAVVGLSVTRKLIDANVIDGVLQASDAHVMVDLLPFRQQVAIFSGIEDLHYINLLLGAHGVISDFATVVPEQMVSMYRSAQEGDHGNARIEHERLSRLWRTLANPTERGARVRAAIEAQRRKVGPPRSPFNVKNAELSNEIQVVMAREGLAWNRSA